MQLLSPTQKYGVIPQDLYEQLSGMKAVKLEASTDFSSLKSIYEGDFCISLRSFQGGFEYSAYNGVVSPAYHVFYKTNNISNAYYRYLFKEHCFIEKMASLTKTFRDGKSIAFSDFSNSMVPVPSLEEQERIASFLDTECGRIDELIEQTRASIEEYKKLKQSVITQAVTKGVRGPRPMKDSGVEWIGEIPEDWEITKFKKLGKCRNGLTYAPQDQCGEEGTLVLRSSNIQNGKLVFDDCVFVNKHISEELMVHPNDILICSRNGSAKLIGKNAIIPEGLTASFGAFMMIYRCKSPQYLQYVLSSHIFSYYLGTFLTVSVNQLTGKSFDNIQFPYPDREEEQNEIINFLDKKCLEIDKLIESKQQLLTELETYKKSLIYEYVTGKKEVYYE